MTTDITTGTTIDTTTETTTETTTDAGTTDTAAGTSGCDTEATANPEDLRRQEYGMLFDAFDTDGDGQMGQLDIDVLVQKWCVALHVLPGEPAWNRITMRANRLWQDLIGHTDADGNKQVSRDEWIDSHDQPGFVEHAAMPWAVGVFDIGDPQGEGRVSLQAWMTCQAVTGWPQPDSLAMFLELDDDKDCYVQRDAFVAYIEQFYANADDDDRWWSSTYETTTPDRSG